MKFENTVILEPTKEKKENVREKIIRELKELGVEKCPKELLERILVIEENSKFNDDSRMIAEGYEVILQAIEGKKELDISLTPEERRQRKLAAYLHDIGKSGPANASHDEQLAIVKLFSIEGIKNIHQSVGDTLREKFSSEQGKMVDDLFKSGISEDMEMLAFWNKHAVWTRDILEEYKDIIPERSRVIAASHHIDKGINPYDIHNGDVPKSVKVISALKTYLNVFEEDILMAVDKYEAIMARSGVTHEKAIDYLLQNYNKDSVMNVIIEVMNELGTEKLFPKTQKYLDSRKGL